MLGKRCVEYLTESTIDEQIMVSTHSDCNITARSALCW